MKQIIQNYRTGEIEVADVPVPNCGTNSILVKNISSLISIGTEKSIIDLGKKSLLGKAKARPDLVKRFLDKAKKEGFLKTFQEALGRLDNPTPLGYSSAGIVMEVGKNVHKFSPGDRVACIGAGYASHAEYITVPENLCCKIPENVDFEEASFGMLGIIALHGVRCANLTFGENVAVIGLGLLGLLTIQILRGYGCRVIGFDVSSSKIEIAKKLGFENVYNEIEEFKNKVDKITNSFGADAVIITAATKSAEPVNVAVDISRQRGRIVMVGVGDIHPNRNEMWHKEVDIVVSKAGGPGIFDPFYENKGIDYPIGYVRWTENRNLEEFLRLISEKKVNVKDLITHRIKIDQALKIYDDLTKNSGNYIGVVIKYEDENVNYKSDKTKILRTVTTNSNKLNIGVIGAGLFGKALLLPALNKAKDVYLHTLSTSSSANVYHTGKKYNFAVITTNYEEILKNEQINAVFILTPHSLHKKMVMESLSAGKHVFVEKPLCVSEEELLEIDELYSQLDPKPLLMVGHNRRFSKHSIMAKQFIGGLNKSAQFSNSSMLKRTNPLVINYRINAGFVSKDHWVHSEEEGGSRVIGEMTHFIDMIIYLTDSYPVSVFAERVSGDDKSIINSDNVSVLIKLSDGSIANLVYSASGDKAFNREYLEIFSEGKVVVLKDYKETELWHNGKKKVFKTMNQDMGYEQEIQSFVDSCLGKEKMEMEYNDIYYSTLTVFKIMEAISKKRVVGLG